MKRLMLLMVSVVLFAGIPIAQTSQAFKYQAVARDNAGNLITNQLVGIRISILEFTITGNPVYVETHSVTTNPFGIIDLVIGQGTVVSGDFGSIQWNAADHFIQIEMDVTGGTNYQLIGTSQLFSVPYALESKHASSLTLTNETGQNFNVSVGPSGALQATYFWACGDTIHDNRDNKIYKTVLIGSQCWMQENLNIGLRIDHTSDQSNNSILEKFCYDDLESNCDVYGGLYQWDELMQYDNTPGARGLCPAGWHVPTDEEWCQMEVYLDPTVNCSTNGTTGTDIALKLKEAGTTHWAPPNTGATNSSGFTALPGGWYCHAPFYCGGSFLDLTYSVFYWTSTQNSTGDAWTRWMDNESGQIDRYPAIKPTGWSTRCVKN